MEIELMQMQEHTPDQFLDSAIAMSAISTDAVWVAKQQYTAHLPGGLDTWAGEAGMGLIVTAGKTGSELL